MRQGRWMTAAALLLATGTAAGAAAAEDGQPEPRKVERVVVTATKIETPTAEIGAAITVVTEEELRAYHYPTVDEALRQVPGLEIRRSGSLGKTTSLSIRGANANQVQVLVDGVRVKSPTLGLAELADISPDLIERIEIIRGPQSTLYGADAIGGVVHIITKKGRGPLAASVQQEVGTQDTLASRGSLQGNWKTLDYALAASHLESNGQFKNDGSDQNALSGRVGVSLPWDSSLGLAVRWNRTDSDLPVKFVCCGPLPVEPLIDVNQQQQSETLVMTLEGRTRPVPWWESRARVSRYDNAMGFQDPVDPGYAFDFPLFSQINVERREAEWINAIHLGRWSTSTVGLEYRHEEGDNKGTFRSRTHTQSLFFEQQLRLLERLFLTGGFRVEDHSVFGTELTERGSLAYLIKGWGTRIRGGAGSGFRAPTLNDLFFPGFSNPGLQPEESFSYDAGVDQTLWQGRVRLGLTYFQNNFTNLIRFVPLAVFPFVGVVNVASARAAGIEFTAEADLLANLVAGVNYTYTDSEDLTTDRPLPREPRHRWNLGLRWEPIRRLSLFTQVHTSSRQFESAAVGYNRGHTRVDVGGTCRLVDRGGWLGSLELTARIQNLLNEGYAEVRGFPALGTQALVGVRASF